MIIVLVIDDNNLEVAITIHITSNSHVHEVYIHI